MAEGIGEREKGRKRNEMRKIEYARMYLNKSKGVMFDCGDSNA